MMALYTTRCLCTTISRSTASARLQAYLQETLETGVGGNGDVEQKGHPDTVEGDFASGSRP